MVSVVVDWIGVHVTDAEGVDQQAEESCDKQEHHSDVIDVDAKAKLVGAHAGRSAVPDTRGEPVED